MIRFEPESLQSFHLTKTCLPYSRQTGSIIKRQFHTAANEEPARAGGNLRQRKTEQRDNRSGQASNLMGLRWPARRPLCPGPPLYIRACLHSTGLLQSLTVAKKKALAFEPAAKKKPLLPPSHSKRDIHMVSLSHSRRIQQQVGQGTQRRRMTGDKLWGGEGSYFHWTKWKAWGCGSLSLWFPNKDQVSDIEKPLWRGGTTFMERWVKSKERRLVLHM